MSINDRDRLLDNTAKKSSPKIQHLLNPIETSSSSSPPSPPVASSSKNKTPIPKKRTRRKFHDVERYYVCDYQNCGKSYGALTHLNEHRVIQKHGPRLKLEDFAEVKKLIEYKKLQQRILNHETVILDAPEDNEYYQSLILQQQHIQQIQILQQQQQQQQQQLAYQQPIYFSPPLPCQEPIPLPLHMPVYQDPRLVPTNMQHINSTPTSFGEPSLYPIPVETTTNINNQNIPSRTRNDRIQLPHISDIFEIDNEKNAEQDKKR